MLLEPWMVGRCLYGEVEGNVDAELARARREPAEVVARAKLRVDRLVAAFLRTDRPRRSRIVWPRGQRVVAALAIPSSDRVDRRQVDHVESQFGQPRQLRLHF